MLHSYKSLLLAILLCAGTGLHAQTILKGKIIDATTKEPIPGASIHCTKEGCTCSCTTNISGEFEIKCTDCQKLSVTSVGYAPQQFLVSDKVNLISLITAASQLQ